MRGMFVVFAVLMVAASAAEARPVNVPGAAPVFGLEIPDDWKGTATSRGIEVKSPDEEVFFWVEVYAPKDQAAVTAEHERYFAKQGVKPAGEPKVARTDAGGVAIKATDLPATWKGAPTILRYLAINPGLKGGEQVLISYWASPEGDKAHDAAFKTVLDSLGPPK